VYNDGMMIGERLRIAREARGHSKEAAAVTIDCSYNAVRRWEDGACQPRGLYRKAVEDYIRESPQTTKQQDTPATG